MWLGVSSAARTAMASLSAIPWQVLPSAKHGCESSALWNPRSDATPSMTNSSSARSILLPGPLPVGVPDDQLGDHRVVEPLDLDPLPRCRESMRTPGPAGSRYRIIGQGPAGSRDGSSALIRHSIAWPRDAMSSCANDSGSPAAIRICSRTRSIPVTISVTGVLDLDAGVHLEEVEVAPLSSRHSTVPAPT